VVLRKFDGSPHLLAMHFKMIEKIKRTVNRFWHLVGGAIGAQLIAIAVAPILLRYYSPTQFGRYSLSLAIGSIMSVGLAGRLDMAIAMPSSEKMASRIFAAALSVSVTLGVISLAITLIGSLLGLWELATSLVGIIIGILLSVFQIQIALISRKRDFKKVTALRISQSILMAAFQLLFAWKFESSYGLEIGCLTALSGIVLCTFVFVEFEKTRHSLAAFRNILLKYRGFWQYDVWSALLNCVSSQLPILLMGHFFASAHVGYYSLSQRILVVPMAVVGSSVAQVFYQEAAERFRNGGINRQYLKRSMGFLLFLGVVIFVPVVLLSEWAIMFLFGAKWMQCALVIKVISPWLFLVFVVSPFSGLFQILGHQRIYLLSNLVLFLLRILVFVTTATLTGNWVSSIFAYSLLGVAYWIWAAVHILSQGAVCDTQSV